MTEIIRKKLSDSPAARWTALLIVSFTMMFGYFFTDVMAPLEPLLTASAADGGLLQCFPSPPFLRRNHS